MESSESRSLPNETLPEVEVLLETFRKEGVRRRNATRAIRLFFASMLALLAIEGLVDITKGKPFDFGSLLILGSLLGGGCAYGLTPGLRRAATRAATLSDLRLLGGMIEALNSGEPKLQVSLEEACRALLERVTSDHVGLLDDYQLDQLLRAVRLSHDKRFSYAALKAMGRIGSNRTLQALEIFANDPALPQNRRSALEPHILAAMGELRLRIAAERVSRADFTLPNRRTDLDALMPKLNDGMTPRFVPEVKNTESAS